MEATPFLQGRPSGVANDRNYDAIKPSSGASKKLFAHSRKRSTPLVQCLSLMLPWLFFATMYGVIISSVHYTAPAVCWGFVGVIWLCVLSVAALTARRVWGFWKGEADLVPVWYIFLVITCTMAAVLGPAAGLANYWNNVGPYYDLQTWGQYGNVDPATAHGTALMDAGTIDFQVGAKLDLAKAYTFQDALTYCVVPIVGNSTPAVYDFWAIGLNCCSRNATGQVNFKCGAYESKTAHQGVRLMLEAQRSFYRMAASQAEATFRIKADHPIFVYWTESIDADMHSYLESGWIYYLLGIGFYFCLQLFLVIVTTFAIAKMRW